MLQWRVAANKRRHAVFVALVTVGLGLLLALAAVLAGLGPAGAAAAVAVAAGLVALALVSAPGLALRVARARPADPDRYPRYANLIEGLCRTAGMPQPKLYVIDSDAANAFAVGYSPARSAVVVTRGLLIKLNRLELEGVLARALASLRSGAARLPTSAVVLGALPAVLRDLSRQDDGRLLGIAAVLATPLAPLLRLAVRRERAFEVDESGAYLTRYPPGLVSALTKMGADPAEPPPGSLGLRHLWIVPPHGPAGQDTHPPLADRIAALKEL